MLLLHSIFPAFLFALFLRHAAAGFIRTFDFPGTNYTAQSLTPLLVFVAIDPDLGLMKFLINTKVTNWGNMTSTEPIITDVDPVTNRYTTLHVEIDFMGRTFVRENLRFCDILAVKNTSSYEDNYRFDGLSSSSSSPTTTAVPSGLANPDVPGLRPNGASNRLNAREVSSTISSTNTSQLISTFSTSLANSNASVEALFANRTQPEYSCPLYTNDSVVFYYQADVSKNFEKFGSYSVRFSVVSNNEESDILGSAIGYVTSSVKTQSLENLLFYGILGVSVCAYIMYFMIIISSPNQEAHNPFLIEASAICNEGLLRQLEAPPLALLSYLQFALFMSGLNVQYPGFFQFLMGRIEWCALLSINVFHRYASIPASEQDNVYVTYYSGLKTLAQYSSNGFNQYSWPNFIVCLLIWTAAGSAGYQIFIFIKVLAQSHRSPSFLRKLFGHSASGTGALTSKSGTRTKFKYSLRTNMWALLGNLLREFLTTFGLPFLVLTIYMLFTASNPGTQNGEPVELIQQNAFSPSIPYNMLYLRPSENECATSKERNSATGCSQASFKIPTLSVVFGSVTLVAWFGSSLLFLYHYISPFSIYGRRKRNVSKLYTSVKAIVMWAYLYNAYRPSKAYYVAVDTFGCILTSIVIAALQLYPSAQVAMMVVLEFSRLVLFLIIRPYYLALSWHSLPLFMHICRLLVTFLNIPYLRQLNVSEASRSYVAYVQMLIHSLVILSYIAHLVYCLAITITAVVKVHKRISNESNLAIEADNQSCASTCIEFEFKQVPLHQGGLLRVDARDSLSSTASSNDGEVDYYRSKSERVLQSLSTNDSHSNAKNSDVVADDISLDFQAAEHRIKQTDYTTREADRIFQKYFSAHEMDPEMKALWESRDWNNNVRPLQAKGDNSVPQKGLFARLLGVIKPTKKRGFEVMRRRPIVVTQQATTDPDETDSSA